MGNNKRDKEKNNNSNINSKGSIPLMNLSGEMAFLETSAEKKTRMHSLWIMYLTTFLQAMAGSIVITGMWPYLQQLDSSTSKEWLGWVVAANPLGQLISSPLIGWVCNRLGATRGPSVFCLIVFISANIWFACLPLHQDKAKWYILVARFLVGVSSGSITACRTFVTQGTLVAERTASISHLSLSQALGFVLGPAGQLALKPLGADGFFIGQLQVNMYTSVGWLTATLGLINLIFFHPKIFVESDIAIREAQGKAKISERDGKTSVTYNIANSANVVSYSPDYLGIMAIVFTFFIVFFVFVLLETLGTPVSMDQFGWSAEKAIVIIAITMIISSVVSTSLFFLIPVGAKYFDERILLIVFGIVPYTLGRLFFFPFASEVAPMRRWGCVDNNGTEIVELNDEKLCTTPTEGYGDELLHWKIVQHGCPASQTWCFEILALSPVMVGLGYGLATLGFPCCMVMCQTLFSKMLGPRPQGVWMGALTSVSSLARVIGPIFVTYIYTEYGTIVTSGTATGLMVLVLVLLLLVYKRLVPLGKRR